MDGWTSSRSLRPRGIGALLVLLLLAGLAAPQRMAAQSADGGVESLFSYGVGARALGLGGAYIASPMDASAVYWNPGGLDLLQRKSATMFYSNLPLGGQYTFVAYAHPTVSLGTFGVGVLRVGSDFTLRDSESVVLGDGSFAQTQFLLSYGKQLPLDFWVGLSIKVEQQNWSTDAASSPLGRGIGVDLGFVYKPEFAMGLLQNSSVGVIIQNAIQPILNVQGVQEQIPRSYKIGLAKTLAFGSQNDTFSFYSDFEIAGEKKAPKLHIGTEYAYRGGAMARVGFTDSELVFGVGAIVNNFQVDYSFGRYAKNTAFEANHRVSLSFSFGKSKQEIVEEEVRRREQEIVARAKKQMRLQQQIEVQNHLDAARALFEKGDYFAALDRYNQAKYLDPENQDAIRGAEQANSRYLEQQSREIEKKAALRAEEQAEAQRRSLIENQLQKGIKYFEAGQYDRAIAEWELGLAEDPDNYALADWIEKTRTQIESHARQLIRDAERLAADGRHLEAIDKFKEVQRNKNIDEALLNKVTADITALQNRITREDAFRKGLTEYYAKNYRDAFEYFEQASRLDPNNKQYREFRDKADARANARDEPFVNEEVKSKYREAVYLMVRDKRYAEALKILREIQQVQKYNKSILKRIDEAEAALEQ